MQKKHHRSIFIELLFEFIIYKSKAPVQIIQLFKYNEFE